MPEPSSQPEPSSRPAALGILLLSGCYRHAHTALLMAASAAALDRPVVLFATQHGLHALCRDWSGLDGSDADHVVQARGVAGFAALRDTLSPLGVRLMACESGLKAIALPPEALLAEVERVGVPTFLQAVGTGQLLSI